MRTELTMADDEKVPEVTAKVPLRLAGAATDQEQVSDEVVGDE